MTITVGSNVRITIGRRQIYGRITNLYNSNELTHTLLYSEATPGEYWDIEFTIQNPESNRGSIGRWKQNVDGGYIELA
jgi:hypothetical protein